MVVSRTDQFLDLYKQLEYLAGEICSKNNVSSYPSSIIQLSKMPLFQNDKAEIMVCRKVRNMLQHDMRINNEYAVQPSEEMISFLKHVIVLAKNPPRAYDFAIKGEDIYRETLETSVKVIMDKMRSETYTHIPILENGNLFGVFSENTIFQYLLDNEIMSIDINTKVSDYAMYLPIDKHITETFEFVAQDCLLLEVKRIFETAFINTKKIGMVFVTHSGKWNEKILGIITPWDVLGNNWATAF